MDALMMRRIPVPPLLTSQFFPVLTLSYIHTYMWFYEKFLLPKG